MTESLIPVQIERADGTIEEVKVDISLAGMSLRQAVDLQRVLGDDQMRRVLSGADLTLPSVLQAILWVRLKDDYDVSIDDFDVDLDRVPG